ncbi:MAG: FkbM family methyltransferase [Rhizobiaceae bacterium]
MRFVEFRRRCQLAIHRLMHGDRYAIHGVTVSIPKQAGTELRYQLMRGRYENDEANAVRKYVPSGSSVIELGGSLGVMSKVIRSTIGPSGAHVVVEANPALIPICRANAVDPSCADKTSLINAAVAYGTDEITFQFGHNAHVGRVGSGATGAGVVVKTISLSELVEKLEAQAPYCLVCDIEGAEYDIFETESAIFEFLSYAIVEIHPEVFLERQKTRDDFLSLLAKRGIKVLEDQGQILVLAGPSAP